MKIKNIFLVNMPLFMEYSGKLFTQFLKKKMLARLAISSDESPLLNGIPLKYLPKDYGGDQKFLQELNGKIKNVEVSVLYDHHFIFPAKRKEPVAEQSFRSRA